jgi:hypothetical protein
MTTKAKATPGPINRDAYERVPHPCGCRNLIGGGIEWCPLHAAAPDMREALALLLDLVESDDPAGLNHKHRIEQARATLALAEGK